MQIVYKNVNDIKPYKNNPRKNKKAIDKVVKSIEEFGFKSPIILDKNNVIICGHTRFEASKKLKLKEVPCIIANELNEEQVKAYRLVDNKVSEFAEWDFDLLDEEIEEIINYDLSDFGFEYFSMEELNELDGYNDKKDDREYFSKTFVFPSNKKKQIICYLKKYQNEIVDMIIKESEKSD